MLIIGRGVGESVRIGESVVTVQKCNRGGRYVRLAIDAPPGVPIVRCELEPRDGGAEARREGGSDAKTHPA